MDPTPQRSTEELLGRIFTEMGRLLIKAGRELLANAPPPAPAPPPVPRFKTLEQQMVELVKQRVCWQLGLPVNELEDSRKAKVVEARRLCWYLLRETAGLSTPQLGRILGERSYDHATVLHGLLKIDQKIEAEPTTYLWVRAVYDELHDLQTNHAAPS